MLLFDVLRLHLPDLDPKRCKLHIATPSRDSDPLDVFFANRFEAWQSWQTKKNFERDSIVSLIKLPGKDRWLFAGCFRKLGRSRVETPGRHRWRYQTEEIEETKPLAGRVVIGFHRTARQPYLNAENGTSNLGVREILPQRMAVSEFPGYHNILITKDTLGPTLAQGVGRARAWGHPIVV